MTSRTSGYEAPVVARRGRDGMTLLEVIFAFGIVVMAIVWTLSTLFSAIAANRIMTANIAANAAILQQREEVMIAANAGVSGQDALAANVLEYFARDLANSPTIPVGPSGELVPVIRFDQESENRGLIYTFPIPAPGEGVNPNNPYDKGYGEMVLYLTETAVPAHVEMDELWEDLGTDDASSGTDPDNSSTPATQVRGYDINGDGEVRNFIWKSAKGLRPILRNPNVGAGNPAAATGMYIHSLPIDITVTYFRDAAHTEHYFSNTRRVMITGVRPGTDESGK